MSCLQELLEAGITMVIPVLKGETPIEQYIGRVKEIIEMLPGTDDEEIRSLQLEESVTATLCADKELLRTYFEKETDRVSLISTVLIFAQCRREGMPNHSPKYMKRVREIRLMIEAYYQDTAVNICG